MLGLVVLVLTWRGGWLFALLWLAAGLAVLAEWLAMSGVRPRPALVLIGGCGLALLTAAGLLGWPRVAGAGILVAVLLAMAATASSGYDRVWGLSGFLYAALVAVVPLAAREGTASGLWLVLWMFAVVWTTDVAAYFVGRAAGGPKLWKRVSPKKTWSGFCGGVAAAAVAGYAVAAAAAARGVPVPWNAGALLVGSAIAAAISQAGDLAESAMKRHFDVKDSGALIPGHGGAMDRLDGFTAVLLLVGVALLGAPVADA